MSDLKNSILTKKRELLTQQENLLLEKIESQTSELNQSLNKTLKKSIYIGGGLMAGYVVYRLLSNDKKENKKAKTAIKKNSAKSRIFKPILSLLAEKGLSLLVHSLKK